MPGDCARSTFSLAIGDYVAKPMSQCNGREILQELAGHLQLGDLTEKVFGDAVSIPCRMPLITSQFMPRAVNDRPPVILAPGSNLALMGQYCEIAEDVVFTVEYSVRSAMTAVYSLLHQAKKPPQVRCSYRHPSVLLAIAKTLWLDS